MTDGGEVRLDAISLAFRDQHDADPAATAAGLEFLAGYMADGQAAVETFLRDGGPDAEQLTAELHRLQAAGASVPRIPRLVPAPDFQPWMDEWHRHHPRQCLPLRLASAAGWLLLSPVAVVASWDGTSHRDAIRIRCPVSPAPCVAHFGAGVLTWTIPFLFRTSPGWDLLLRGPANWWKDGIAPLEGLVETDWAVSTTTYSWQFTRPGTVAWEVGEPFCMIVPQRRGELERVRPVLRAPSADEAAGERAWARQRRANLGEHAGYEGDYRRGRGVAGEAPPDHRTRLRLRHFEASTATRAERGSQPAQQTAAPDTPTGPARS